MTEQKPKTAKEIFRELKAINPFVAARFERANRAALLADDDQPVNASPSTPKDAA
jgi:hypothetical protein